MKTFLNIFFFLSIAIFISSCKKDDIEQNEDSDYSCTDQVETIYIKVTKFNLDKYYTIRLSTGDTLNNDSAWQVYDNKFPIVNDFFQKKLRGRIETFRFQGLVGDSLVVSEDIQVSANVCHIYYVSGKLNID